MGETFSGDITKPIPTIGERYIYFDSKKDRRNKIFYLIGVATWLASFYAFFLLYDGNLFYLMFFGGVMIFLGTGAILSSSINLLKKSKFTCKSATIKGNSIVDIFLPVCGEDKETLRNTWEGVRDIDYPHKNVYVLDDIGDEDAQKMAKEFNFVYISRPNKGVMKKAGNLQYAFERTNGEFIIIFDADFRPDREFINILLPMMADPSVGIVQSPQFFDTDGEGMNPLQKGAGDIQEHFYRTVQVARGELNASICVGTNAIYRRSALDKIGGTYQIEHSEDVWTGYSLLKEGYRTQYVPIILAKGVCPSDSRSFYQQQSRWCNGSMSLLTSKKFWDKRVPFLTKLPYISGFMFYIGSIFTLIFPLQTYAILWTNNVEHDRIRTLIFVSAFVYFLFTTSYGVYRKFTLGTLIASTIQTFSYAFTLFLKVFGKTERWIPTGAREKRGTYGAFKIFFISYTFLMTVLLVRTFIAGKLHMELVYVLPVFWILYSLSLQYISLWYMIIFERKNV